MPTVIEGGVADYEVTSWNGLAARTGTSAGIIAELNNDVVEALKSPEVQTFSTKAGMDAHGMSSDELRQRIKRDVAKWTLVIDKAGIKKR